MNFKIIFLIIRYFHVASSYYNCPEGCYCSYDIIYCDDLISDCHECSNYSQIDFNRITQFNKEAFKNFRFATNKITRVNIYRLLNSSIVEDTFKNFKIPDNSTVEFVFQYASFIHMRSKSIGNLAFGKNGTLVFYFPYTTQIFFDYNFVGDLLSTKQDCKILIKVFKSTSVKFFGANRVTYFKNCNVTIDIKYTHIVEFEKNSFSGLTLDSSTINFGIDYIDKVSIESNAFSNIQISNSSQFIQIFKQVQFLELHFGSFNDFKLSNNSSMKLILSDLADNYCTESYSFKSFYLLSNSSLNITYLNTKNLILMGNTFYNFVLLDSQVSVNLLNQPNMSYLVPQVPIYREFQDLMFNLTIETNLFSNFSRQTSKNDLISMRIDNVDMLHVENEIMKGSQSNFNLEMIFNDVENFFVNLEAYESFSNVDLKLNRVHNIELHQVHFKQAIPSPKKLLKIWVNSFQLKPKSICELVQFTNQFELQHESFSKTSCSCDIIFMSLIRQGSKPDNSMRFSCILDDYNLVEKCKIQYASLCKNYVPTKSVDYEKNCFKRVLKNNTQYQLFTSIYVPLNSSALYHKELTIKKVGKIIGILFLCFIIAIILFMIVVNLIHYYLVDQSDNYDDQDQPWTWKRTFSVQSLKRSISVTSLRRLRKDEKSNRMKNAKNKSKSYLQQEKDTSVSDDEYIESVVFHG